MILTARAIEYVSVNSFAPVERLELVQGNGGTYRVQIMQADGSRYVPAAGATGSIVFPRTLSIAATPSNQDTTCPLTLDANDRSIASFALTAAQVDKIVSEGAKLVLTESGVTSTWPVDHLVRKRSSAPGA